MNQRSTPDIDAALAESVKRARSGKPSSPKPNGGAGAVPPIDLRDVSPVIAELLQHGTQNGKPVKRPARRFFAAMRALYDSGHSFGAVLTTLQANPNGVHARFKDVAAETQQVWDRLDQVATILDEFNSKYFVVCEYGHARIYVPRQDPILKRRMFERMSFEDLKKLYLNRIFRTGETARGEPVYQTAAEIWLTHKDRHQYLGGVIFDPSGRKCPADTLNLWRGFNVTPRPGPWPLMQAHIHAIICGGRDDYRNYLLDHMADTVQNPDRKAEVAVVLKGDEGCGKGILARAFAHLFGPHGIVVTNPDHLTGKFNAHLRDCVVAVGDEAFVSGDKTHEAVLRTIVSEPYIVIEPKFIDACQAANFTHVWLLTNNEWAVPMSLRSRRWFVLEARADRIGDHAYFAAIQAEMENGGYEAMLHDLQHRDLSKRNLRAVPVTGMLMVQRKYSLATIEAWWLDCLHRGYVFVSRLGLEDHWQQWHPFLATEVLFESYSRYCEQRRERHPLSRELFGAWLKDAGAKPRQGRDQPVGEHITNIELKQGHKTQTVRGAELIMRPRVHGYALGALRSARRTFAKTTGLSFEWG
jgi:hypothetical protein